MLKILRRVVFVVASLVILVCAGLLVTNFDPNNPTQRRYSSEVVLSTGEAPADTIGRDGERVLSKDLNLARNDETVPVLAFCNDRFEESEQPPAKHIACIYYSASIENYRVPDFYADGFIAESKNSATLTTTQERNYKQIQAFAVASTGLNRPLYIYVRHNTRVDPEYYALVESTGGQVIHYFQTTGYVDQTDFHLLLGIIGGLSIIIIWTGIARIVTFFTPTPKSSVVVPEHKTSRKARKSFDNYDDFMRNAGDNARKTLDE